ncbi:hypothetical protein PF001_g26259 [Phytophthora fragariae]|uniref:Uncharacterized protein n=1 Tax=Phytophthora fragariae TaxID=53985 RepID=A0A6A4BN96_9STRA|nr:hypothetical protein PF001_g26259 [Phytophthora fragariae]
MPQPTLATLRAVGQQLALTVDAAQFHLQVAAGHDSPASCSQDDADEFAALSSEIEGLQTQLQAVLGSVLAQSRHKIVAAAAAAEVPVDQHTDETIDLQAKTESEDHGPEIEPQEHKSTAGRTAKPKPDLPSVLQNFVQSTGRITLSDLPNKKRGLSSNALAMCRAVARRMVALMESDNCLDDASACLFRDTLERLAEAVEGLQPSEKISIKLVVLVAADLGRILELASAVSGTSAALESAELRSSRLKLMKYSEEHMDDMLMRMHTFVENVQQQKERLAGDHALTCIRNAIKRLAYDLRKEITTYKICQEMGLPERSEERWQIFKVVAGGFGDWIEHTAVPATPSKELKPLYLAAKIFGDKFPDRVPFTLLEWVIAKTTCSVVTSNQPANVCPYYMLLLL